MNNEQRNAQYVRNLRASPIYLGIFPELGGETLYVISLSADGAKKLLLKAWRRYDRLHHSDYHGQVKTFDNLAEIYGAQVTAMPLDEVVHETQMEPIL